LADVDAPTCRYDCDCAGRSRIHVSHGIIALDEMFLLCSNSCMVEDVMAFARTASENSFVLEAGTDRTRALRSPASRYGRTSNERGNPSRLDRKADQDVRAAPPPTPSKLKLDRPIEPDSIDRNRIEIAAELGTGAARKADDTCSRNFAANPFDNPRMRRKPGLRAEGVHPVPRHPPNPSVRRPGLPDRGFSFCIRHSPTG
jgi:hypothetical protein